MLFLLQNEHTLFIYPLADFFWKIVIYYIHDSAPPIKVFIAMILPRLLPRFTFTLHFSCFTYFRWVKFEEDVEDGGNRWSKPHVATLSLHSLFELRNLLTKGVIILDMDAQW